MGSVRTDAKRQAARENGKRGGWKKGRPLSMETRLKISATKTRQMLRRVFGDSEKDVLASPSGQDNAGATDGN